MTGFDARNRDSINRLYICRKCNLIFREPCQLSCGHRQCTTCIENTEGDIIKCTECHDETPKNEIMPDRGFRNGMKSLSIICSLCPWNGLFNDYEEHLKTAHPNPICEFCEEKFNSTIELNKHKQQECTKITVSCALKEYGCLDLVCRAQLQEHYLSDIHQKIIISIIRRIVSKPTNEQQVSGMDVDIEQGAASLITTTANENISTQMQEIYETTNTFANEIQTLTDNTQRLSSESIRLQSSTESLTQEISSLKLSIQEYSSFLDGVKPNQEILQQDVALLKQKIDDMQYVSYDGTLIWKIKSFHEKMMDAQSERQTSTSSPPFYSSPTGYKMRARLYLNGDGNARRTHMSLFFVLMRGPNDAILKFPFNYKVTFCLYDQTPQQQQQHIIDSFRPDIKSNSFQRPRSEMNIASGIPEFVPLTMIQQEGNPYVRDDTMFIRIMVDFGDMSKILLSYALSLDPGLPMHIQQLMIKQEIERREQQQSQQTPISTANHPITLMMPPNNETQSGQTIFNLIPSPNAANTNDRSQDPTNN